jgi:hypothetical protein
MFKDYEKEDYMDALKYLISGNVGQVLIKNQLWDPVWKNLNDDIAGLVYDMETLSWKAIRLISDGTNWTEYEPNFVGFDLSLNGSESKWTRVDLYPKCECGNKQNPIGQGHSHWCKMFKQEF